MVLPDDSPTHNLIWSKLSFIWKHISFNKNNIVFFKKIAWIDLLNRDPRWDLTTIMRRGIQHLKAEDDLITVANTLYEDGKIKKMEYSYQRAPEYGKGNQLDSTSKHKPKDR
jgi:hypothetical protein